MRKERPKYDDWPMVTLFDTVMLPVYGDRRCEELFRTRPMGFSSFLAVDSIAPASEFVLTRISCDFTHWSGDYAPPPLLSTAVLQLRRNEKTVLEQPAQQPQLDEPLVFTRNDCLQGWVRFLSVPAEWGEPTAPDTRIAVRETSELILPPRLARHLPIRLKRETTREEPCVRPQRNSKYIIRVNLTGHILRDVS